MEQSSNEVSYDVIGFDPDTGVLELYIHELQNTIAVEVPIVNNKFLTGDELLSYVAGFIPVHTVIRRRQLASVTNTDDFKQFITINSKERSLAASVRAFRHKLLCDCDWVMMPDTGFSEQQMNMFREYRQKLRDVPQQPGFPHNVVWPKCDGEWPNHPGVKTDAQLDS